MARSLRTLSVCALLLGLSCALWAADPQPTDPQTIEKPVEAANQRKTPAPEQSARESAQPAARESAQTAAREPAQPAERDSVQREQPGLEPVELDPVGMDPLEVAPAADQTGNPAGNPPKVGREMQQALTPQQGVLVLKNGNVLTGTIVRAGDRYYVARPGGELVVRADQVEFPCRDLDEGFAKKRALINEGSVAEHLELAQWCLSHSLADYAARELAEVNLLAPDHPRLELLLRRLRFSRLQAESVSAEEDHDRAPSSEELDRLTRGLPPGTVETFTTSVQPLLVNNCAASSCHGSRADNGFQLLRPPSGRPASRRLTQRNLYNTLSKVDFSNVQKSDLLVKPTVPHGDLATPIFTDRTADQYQVLKDWVAHLTKREKKVSPQSVQPVNPARFNRLPEDWPGELPPRGTPGPSDRMGAQYPGASQYGGAPQYPGASQYGGAPQYPGPSQYRGSDRSRLIPPGDDSRGVESRGANALGVESQDVETRGPVERGVDSRGVGSPAASGYRPRDAFDPEIFNRRYLPPRSDEDVAPAKP
jgi:hypothetical protein